VLGTERHEARRIDNQLRGRAGRQGDPGETQFYVSLEDDLMRVFGSDSMKKMMGRFGIPEDQPIQNGMITKALENSQAKIEGFNFDARKHTLEYDDVMNHQRKVVYERRRTMLGNKLDEVEAYLDGILPEAIEEVQAKVLAKKEQIGRDAFLESVRRIALYVTDLLWVEHLETMEYMRSSVNLRAYGQREPLVEYKKEGLRMFKEMEMSYKEQLFSLIETINTAPPADVQVKEILTPAHQEGLILGQGDKKISDNSSEKSAPEVGRNDPCPCGSGKKYKKCHGA
jgi:preprotein translocase subunit SecA